MCHVSPVTCQNIFYTLKKSFVQFFFKVRKNRVELVGGGSVIKGGLTPSSLYRAWDFVKLGGVQTRKTPCILQFCGDSKA